MKTSRFVSFLKNGISLVLIAGLLLGLSLISSCAAPSAPTTPASPTTTTSLTPSPTPTAKHPSIIRHTDSFPANIDPAIGTDGVAGRCQINMYDTLVFPTKTGDYQPWVATKWTVSDDGMVWTFDIRPGIKFHSGNELTAEDVVYSMNRLIAIGEGWGYIFRPLIKETKALDKYKVQFTLNHPFGPFIDSLVRLYIVDSKLVKANTKPEGKYGENGDYGVEWMQTHDAGSGPYMLKEIKREEHVLMVKFPDYWNGWDPNAPEACEEITIMDPSTLKAEMASRNLEISDYAQTWETYQALAKIEGIKIASFWEGGMWNVMLNTKKPPTDDIHFRRALAYCIDYETVINTIFPGSKLAEGPVASSVPGFAANLPTYRFDLEKAREELAQSPYADQLDKYPVELAWVSEVPDEEKVALLLQANAQKLGIKVEIKKIPWLTVVDSAARPETTPNATVVLASPAYGDAGVFLEMRYHSRATGVWSQLEWLQDPEIDSLIDDALKTIDRDERFQKYAKIQEKLVDLCPTIWLCQQVMLNAYQAAYVDWYTANGQACPLMHYNHYYHDFRVYPDKVPGS